MGPKSCIKVLKATVFSSFFVLSRRKISNSNNDKKRHLNLALLQQEIYYDFNQALAPSWYTCQHAISRKSDDEERQR